MTKKSRLPNLEIRNIGDFFSNHSTSITAYSIAILFMWGALLKILPVEAPVRFFLHDTIFFLSEHHSGALIGFWELFIGLSFLTKRYKIGIPLILLHQIMSFITFLVIPFKVFKVPWLELGNLLIPWVLDIEGIYVLKNLVIISSVLMIADKESIKFDRPLFEKKDYLLVIGFFAILTVFSIGPYLSMGSPPQQSVSLYVTDYNQDGYQDFLAMGGGNLVLYENLDGKGFKPSNSIPSFEVETGEYTKGVPFVGWMNDKERINSALFFDYNNDNREDLFLLPSKGDGIFLENTENGFIKKDVGLEHRFDKPSSVTTADFDNNGCKDIFVAQSDVWGSRTNGGSVPAGIEKSEVSLGNDTGAKNLLFYGDCSNFEKANNTGIKGKRWSLVTSAVDLNQDNIPDIHVANDFGRDTIYLGQENKSFRRIELSKETSRNGMSSEINDINEDGLPDIFVSNIFVGPKSLIPIKYPTTNERLKGHNLLINKGKGSFEDKAKEYGLNKGGIGGWGTSSEISDFNNDGDIEIIQSKQYMNMFSRWAPNQKPNYWGKQGEKFETVSTNLERANSKSMVSLDYDRDGSLELIVGHSERTIFLYDSSEDVSNLKLKSHTETISERNGLKDYGFKFKPKAVKVLESKGNWIQLDLGDDTIGSKVSLEAENQTFTQFGNSKSDWGSQSSREFHFGLGYISDVENISIEWQNGTRSTIKSPEVNQTISLN